MGRVSGNWITGTHSGRACRHEDIYTKVNKKTGKCYSVKLCNPVTEWTEKQEKHRSDFALMNIAAATWLKSVKAKGADDYKVLKAGYDRQNKYATLRGYLIGKGYVSIDRSAGEVNIKFGAGEKYDIDSLVPGMSTSGSSGSGGSSSGGGSTSGGDSGEHD